MVSRYPVAASEAAVVGMEENFEVRRMEVVAAEIGEHLVVALVLVLVESVNPATAGLEVDAEREVSLEVSCASKAA